MVIDGGSFPCEHDADRLNQSILIVASIGTFGVLVQNAAYAVVIPIYLVIHLSTSLLMLSRRKSDFLIDVSDLAAIPASLALGYVFPAIVMSLPAPSMISFGNKQTFMALWQMFPMWVAMLQAIIPYLIRLFSQDQAQSARHSLGLEIKSLRILYTSLLVIAGFGQTSTFTLLAVSKWFPNLFASEFKGVFNPYHVFKPVAVSSSVKMPSIESGALLLLQYDELIGSASLALFATVLYVCAYQESKQCQSKGLLVLQGLAINIMTGPLGYATACIWARDELVIGENDPDSKKVK